MLAPCTRLLRSSPIAPRSIRLTRSYAAKAAPAAAASDAPAAPAAAAEDKPPVSRSSCLAGTPLPGLEVLKTDTEIVAQPDSAYPDWLWTILTPKLGSHQPVADGKFDPVAEKKKLRAKNRADIKAKNFLKAT